MKVVVKLMGGLGNQMFQYSFGRFISDKTGRELILDTSFLERRDMGDDFTYRDYDLDVFNLDVKLVSGFNESFELISQDWNHLHKIQPELIERSLTSDSDNIYIDGYWQSPKYFNNENYFEFKYPILDSSLNLLKEIKNTESVMIHVRRGDYVNNKLSGCLGRDYIENVINILPTKEYKFYIFSDDVEWCYDNLSDIGFIVDNSHSGFKGSNHLQLMSACKYFIIPNSSFAWWSAFLSNKKDVYYPEEWILNYHQKIEDLSQKSGLKLNKVMNNIKADELILGKNVIISPTATIRGLNGNAKKIVIGDNTYIGDNVQIILDEFEIGDYCKVHHHVNFHGYKPLIIGHNAWIGQGTIIDSIGGATIGNNCGIGAYSQLWSHIKYGDPLEGCNYNNNSPLVVGNDVWFVGHCIVSPIVAKDKSMALVGSVVTKDMDENKIYAGSPAKDVSSKMRPQFKPMSIADKMDIINQLEIPNYVKFIEDDSEIKESDIIYFNLSNRTYTKTGSDKEIEFMKYLQSKLIKFTPKKY